MPPPASRTQVQRSMLAAKMREARAKKRQLQSNRDFQSSLADVADQVQQSGQIRRGVVMKFAIQKYLCSGRPGNKVVMHVRGANSRHKQMSIMAIMDMTFTACPSSAKETAKTFKIHQKTVLRARRLSASVCMERQRMMLSRLAATAEQRRPVFSCQAWHTMKLPTS